MVLFGVLSIFIFMAVGNSDTVLQNVSAQKDEHDDDGKR